MSQSYKIVVRTDCTPKATCVIEKILASGFCWSHVAMSCSTLDESFIQPPSEVLMVLHFIGRHQALNLACGGKKALYQ